MAAIVLGVVAAGCSDSDDSADRVDETTTTTGEQPDEALELEVDDTVVETSGVEAQESNPDPDGPEFIELSYYETQMGTGGTPPTNCEDPEPGIRVCDVEATGAINGTHVGNATETQRGKMRFTSEPCVKKDGTESTLVWLDADGTIFSQFGDQLDFLLRVSFCGTEVLPGYWTVTGGTGRFEDASGTMSGRPDDVGSGSSSVGVLRVRADLWADILPPVD